MAAQKILGVMRPLGGGDPIPLTRDEMLIGRRPTNDIQLDFENVSGKHCVLRLVKGVWQVRDLGSTNGTKVNGQKIEHEHGLLPDDELEIATHGFTIDYEPAGPTSIRDANLLLGEELGEADQPQRKSLMELAGLEGGEKDRRSRPPRAPERIEPPGAGEFDKDDIPDHFQQPGRVEASDDDFFRLIQEDVEQEKPKGR